MECIEEELHPFQLLQQTNRKEFLSRMNQTMQIHTSEHMLQEISGNPIVATRKKRLTNAKNSSDKTTDT